jgi:hypothetical protein
MSCILCNTRKARRRCPAAEGEICPQCCAEYREEKLDCPLDCEYLLEARKHEKLTPVAPAAIPHPEVRLTDEFLNRNDMLVRFTMACVAMAAMETPGVTDADMREAIDSMIQTLKTADSGLIYETKPVNPYAATVHEKIKEQVDKLRSQIAEQSGGAALRDKDMLGVLVFLSRVGASLNNGRRKGRAFLSMLHEKLPLKKPEVAAAPSIITS